MAEARLENKSQIPQDAGSLDVQINFHQIFGVLYRYWWFILGMAFTGFSIAYLDTLSIKPQYQTTALVQINNQSSNEIMDTIGFTNPMMARQASQASIESVLMRSRYILEPVIKKTGYNIIVKPQYLPYIGHWIANRHRSDRLASSWFGLKQYAWGGEQVDVKEFTVPKALEGVPFELTVGADNTYQVKTQAGRLILSGVVGQPAVSNLYPDMSLQIDQLIAHPGTRFQLTYQLPVNLVSRLADQLSIMDVGKQSGLPTMMESGILQVNLNGADPLKIQTTLNQIVDYAINANVAQKSEEAEKTLSFLNQKMPSLKSELVQAEDSLNDYRVQTNSFDPSAQAKLLFGQIVELQTDIDKLKFEKEELLQTYTPSHPLVLAADHRQSKMEEELQNLENKARLLPKQDQESMGLLREATIKDKLYEGFFSKMQQLEIVKAGMIGDVTLLGDATPSTVLPNNKLRILLVGVFFGTVLAIAAVLTRYFLTRPVEDPDELELEVGIPISAIVPFSKKQKSMERDFNKALLGKVGYSLTTPLMLSAIHPDDIAIESLRSLRTTLQVQSVSSDKRRIAILGSNASIGKSFISLNLAQVLSDLGRRVLVIDADMRKGQLHKRLLQAKTPGLSEYLSGDVEWRDILHLLDSGLSFIACGDYSKHPSELLQNNRLKKLLDEAGDLFDDIIVDTPPILAITDAVLIAKYCDMKLFVASAGKDLISDVKTAVKRARFNQIHIDGIVFNHQRPVSKYGSYYSYRYQYYYSYGNN